MNYRTEYRDDMPAVSHDRVRAALYDAVLLLASHKGSIEERLAETYFSHWRTIDPTTLLANARSQFEWISEELKKMYPTPGKTDAADRGTAVLVAQSIILLHYSLKSVTAHA